MTSPAASPAGRELEKATYRDAQFLPRERSCREIFSRGCDVVRPQDVVVVKVQEEPDDGRNDVHACFLVDDGIRTNITLSETQAIHQTAKSGLKGLR